MVLKKLVNHLTHRDKDRRGVSIIELMQLKDTCKNKSNTGMGVTEIDPTVGPLIQFIFLVRASWAHKSLADGPTLYFVGFPRPSTGPTAITARQLSFININGSQAATSTEPTEVS